jgi:hypothetical protein
MLVAAIFSAPMICFIANTMAAMRITFLNVCNEALVRNNRACLQAITRLAFENLHERVSVACLNFLVRMPRHRLLAFRAIRPLDDIVHRALHCLQAGARDGLRDFRERSFDVFAFRANESK